MRYKILRLAKGGMGVSHHNGKVYFVAEALPGESGKAVVTKEKARYAYARVLTLDQRAVERCDDLCPNKTCGACGFRHVAAKYALKLKAESVHGEIIKAARLEPLEMQVCELDGLLDGRRTRARVHVKAGRLGFYAAGSHDIVPASRCLVIADNLRQAIQSLETHLCLAGLSNFDIQLDLDVHGRAFACFKSVQASSEQKKQRTKRSRRRQRQGGPRPTSFEEFSCQTIEKLKIFAEGALARGDFAGLSVGPHSFGEAHVESRTQVQGVELVNYRKNGDFAQATDAANAMIHQLLVDALMQQQPRYVLDLFSGTGNLTFRAATCVPRSLAIERFCDAAAFERGVTENQAAFCDNAKVELKLFDLNKGLPKEADNADFVIADPPRAGLTQALITALLALKAKTIFYVSCESSALARDIVGLKSSYAVESLSYVDMFPQTPQVESIALLKLLEF